jgi:hypothetical protein
MVEAWKGGQFGFSEKWVWRWDLTEDRVIGKVEEENCEGGKSHRRPEKRRLVEQAEAQAAWQFQKVSARTTGESSSQPLRGVFLIQERITTMSCEQPLGSRAFRQI